MEENREKLYEFLSQHVGGEKEVWKTEKTKNHPPAFTVEEWKPHSESLFPNANMCKNLFLKDKKKNSLWLVVALEDTEVDMKKLTKNLGFSSGSLRFAPEEALEETLKVKKGSVTPLGLVNDTKNQIRVIIDSRMVENPEKEMLFHPLSNDYSTVLKGSELKSFLSATGNQVEYRDFSLP